MGDERGQGTVEWVGTLAVVALLLVGLVAAGVRVPGGELARGIASRILCAVELADGCGDEPVLIATYGDEIGRLVRRHMPTIGFESGSHAVPIDWRHCRMTSCGDGTDDGLVHRTDDRLPVTAFVHVVDCRAAARARSEAEGDDCSDGRAGALYIQYWLYYANSAGLSSSKPRSRFSSISRLFKREFCTCRANRELYGNPYRASCPNRENYPAGSEGRSPIRILLLSPPP